MLDDGMECLVNIIVVGLYYRLALLPEPRAVVASTGWKWHTSMDSASDKAQKSNEGQQSEFQDTPVGGHKKERVECARVVVTSP